MCPECKRAYPSKTHLQNHFKQMHRLILTMEELDNVIQQTNMEISQTLDTKQDDHIIDDGQEIILIERDLDVMSVEENYDNATDITTGVDTIDDHDLSSDQVIYTIDEAIN